jgi:hypothetical protein
MATREIGYYPAVTTPALDDEFLTQQKGVTKKSEEIFDVIPYISEAEEIDLSLSDFLIGNDGSNKKISLQQLLDYVKSVVKLYIYGGATSLPRRQDTDEYSADSDSWASKTDMPPPARSYLAATTILNKGYICGGISDSGTLQDTEEYDPDVWTSKSNMNSPARAGHAFIAIIDSGYSFGSSEITGDTSEYRPDVWLEKTDMTVGREDLAASEIYNKGYIYGGSTTSGYLLNTDEYNPDTWTVKSAITDTPRAKHAATTVLNKGYIFGGQEALSVTLQSTVEYDPDVWTSKTDMLVPIFKMAASTVLNKGYICGGASGPIDETYEYNPSTDSWSSKADIPFPARSHFDGSTIGG